LFRYSCERLLTVFGFGDFVISRGKHIADDLAIVRLVLEQQDYPKLPKETNRN
jgi:hypothetical protein